MKTFRVSWSKLIEDIEDSFSDVSNHSKKFDKLSQKIIHQSNFFKMTEFVKFFTVIGNVGETILNISN